MEINIYTKKGKIPTTRALQNAIYKAGFDFTLDKGFDTKSKTYAYWKGSYKGEEIGYDYVVEPHTTNNSKLFTADQVRIGDADTVITLGVFSKSEQTILLHIIAGVLTQMTDGLMYSSYQSQHCITPDKAIQETKNIIAAYEKSRDNKTSSDDALVQFNDKDSHPLSITFAKMSQKIQHTFSNIL